MFLPSGKRVVGKNWRQLRPGLYKVQHRSNLISISVFKKNEHAFPDFSSFVTVLGEKTFSMQYILLPRLVNKTTALVAALGSELYMPTKTGKMVENGIHSSIWTIFHL